MKRTRFSLSFFLFLSAFLTVAGGCSSGHNSAAREEEKPPLMELVSMKKSASAGTILVEEMLEPRAVAAAPRSRIGLAFPWSARSRVVGRTLANDVPEGYCLSLHDLKIPSSAVHYRVERKGLPPCR